MLFYYITVITFALSTAKEFVLNNTGKLFSSGENFDISHKLKHNFCQLIRVGIFKANKILSLLKF